MVGKYRRDDSDEDDDNSSLEEGQTRNRHPKHRSKVSIDREIHVRDSRKSDEDRRSNYNGGNRERESRDEKYRDSSSRRYHDNRDSRRRERDRDSSDSEKDLKKVSVDRDRDRERDVRRGKEREFEEKSVVKSKIDDPVVVVERNRDSRQEKLKSDEEKELRNRYRRDDRESGRRDRNRDGGDSRRRRNRDSSESEDEDERQESKIDTVDRNSRRRHDQSKAAEDVVKVVKDLDVRERRGERVSEKRERDSGRRKRDSSESEEDVLKSKVDHRDSSSRRHHDTSKKAEDDAVEVKDSDVRGRRDDRVNERVNERRDRDSGRRKRDSSESEEDVPKSKVDHRDRYKDKDSTSTRKSDKNVSDSDEDGEIRDGKGMESRHRRRRHDDDSASSDEDLNRGMKSKGKNQNGERMKEDGRGKESSDDEEKVKRGKRRREVESTKHRGRDEHPRDRERERKLEKKRDDYDDTPRRPRASEDENKPRRHFLDRVTDKELKKYSSKPENPAGTYAALGSEGLNTDAAAIAGKTGGVYIPPFKLAQMMKGVEDKSSREYQRLTWDALRKSINGLVNKVNAANLKNIVTELFEENLIRGRGLFCRSCMKSQMASPGFTDVFSALVAVVNTKFPQIGELLLRRISLQLKRAYKRNDKHQLLASVKFIAHLVNQQVAHEIIALELLTVLLEKPSDDSVEVAVGFVTECGALLQDLSPQGLQGIFERFRGILHEGQIDKRVQFLIEGLFAIRRAKFQGHVAVRPELDLVDPEDQLTHELSLEETVDPETSLDIFQEDPDFLENEKRYEDLVKNILGDDNKDGDESSSGEEVESGEDDDDSEEENEEAMKIKDETETNLVNLRRTIYLTIMSSVDFEEAGHKLLKIKLEPGQEMELCIMLLECCSQERTYLRYYGLLGQRFCMINKIHQENFEKCFVQQYSMIHRLETNKLRNVAKFFAHLLGTDALPWHVLSYIRLTEEDTTSSSRIFIKILFQELSEHLGIRLLNERLTDPAMQDSFDSIFPKDNPKNTRFSINFFTSIGLGGITENLREYLKNMPRLIMQQQTQDDDDDSNGGSSPSGSSGSDSESSEEESPRKKRKRRH